MHVFRHFRYFLSLLAPLLLVMFATPPPAGADVKWGVHLASYRTQENAVYGWRQLLVSHHELLSGLQQHYVPVNIPGKGDYLRLIVGPLQGREQALELEDHLRSRGTYADTMPCPENTTAAQASERETAPARTAAASVRAPRAPMVAAVQAPSAPRKPAFRQPANMRSAPGRQAAKATSSREQQLREGLLKYVPAPVVEGMRTMLEPLTREEQQSREKLPSPPQESVSGLSGKGHHVGFRSTPSAADGVTLARPRNDSGRISALYGNMEEDFETPQHVSPLSGGDNSYGFKPYFGLGFHF